MNKRIINFVFTALFLLGPAFFAGNAHAYSNDDCNEANPGPQYPYCVPIDPYTDEVRECIPGRGCVVRCPLIESQTDCRTTNEASPAGPAGYGYCPDPNQSCGVTASGCQCSTATPGPVGPPMTENECPHKENQCRALIVNSSEFQMDSGEAVAAKFALELKLGCQIWYYSLQGDGTLEGLRKRPQQRRVRLQTGVNSAGNPTYMTITLPPAADAIEKWKKTVEAHKRKLRETIKLFNRGMSFGYHSSVTVHMAVHGSEASAGSTCGDFYLLPYWFYGIDWDMDTISRDGFIKDFVGAVTDSTCEVVFLDYSCFGAQSVDGVQSAVNSETNEAVCGMAPGNDPCARPAYTGDYALSAAAPGVPSSGEDRMRMYNGVRQAVLQAGASLPQTNTAQYGPYLRSDRNSTDEGRGLLNTGAANYVDNGQLDCSDP